MLNTFARKFTLLFWTVFLIITIPIFIFSTFYVKSLLENSEKEKIEVMVKTLKPTIALNLSFDQIDTVESIFETILKEKNMIRIEFESAQINKTFIKKEKKCPHPLLYQTTINDPFDENQNSNLKIYYTNEYLSPLYNKISTILVIIFLFSLSLFLLFYLFMKKELNALSSIADSFQNYSEKGETKPIVVKGNTKEIKTITKSANKMIEQITTYLQELRLLNDELEAMVAKKVDKIKMQEKLLIHQSRQAAMGEMLESIAHQWRQPLNIIGIATANLEMEHALGTQNDKSFSEKMEIISTNINYMSNTIDDFRNFLNPNREHTHFNAQESIAGVIKILSAQLKNNNIAFSINSNGPVELYGVENEFKQVLFIIINNSIDAIKSQIQNATRVKGVIDITLSSDNKNSIITFCDNGGGVKEDIQHSIFNPYFTTKFASSGTGIGLYMAKNIIKSRMKGKISVFNTEMGCCFKIEQPIYAKEAK